MNKQRIELSHVNSILEYSNEFWYWYIHMVFDSFAQTHKCRSSYVEYAREKDSLELKKRKNAGKSHRQLFTLVINSIISNIWLCIASSCKKKKNIEIKCRNNFNSKKNITHKENCIFSHRPNNIRQSNQKAKNCWLCWLSRFA